MPRDWFAPTASRQALRRVERSHRELRDYLHQWCADGKPRRVDGDSEFRLAHIRSDHPAFSITYSGFVNGETASVVNGTPAFSTPATVTSGVGNYSVTPLLGTLTAANYTFGPFNNGILIINAAPLTITSGIMVNNKVYDRTVTATLSSNDVELSTVFNGDAVRLNTNGYVAYFASAGAGNNIAVTVGGLTLAGPGIQITR